MSAAVSSAEVNTVLYDGNAAEFATPPDVIAYANTAYVTPPSEFQITTSGTIWRYNQWIALMKEGNWVEAKTTVETTTVGVQFWGDSNDGWARVLVDGEEVWTGDTYGDHLKGDAFIKYLEISGLDKGIHTIRVENMGIDGPGGFNHVTVYFFGLMAPSPVSPTPGTGPVSERGLVAYYPFDGDVRDYSGNNNHATNNGATFVSGVRNQALSFDGTDDYVRSPVNINPERMPQMTMVAWVKADVARSVISHDNGGFDRTIGYDTRGGGAGWSAFSGTGGVLGFDPVKTGEWTFLAAVYDQDSETVKLYVNDNVYEEKGKLSSGWDYTNIGSNPSYGGYISGIIDEVRIYNVALSQSEINSIRQGSTVPGTTPTPTPTPTPSPTPISERGLVAYYPFDGDVRDYSGNNNHGTNNGATFVSGVRNQALSFDGTDDYVRSPVNINPDKMPQLTIVSWAKSDLESRTLISHDNGGFDRTIAIDNRGGGLGWSAFSGSGGVLGFHPATLGQWTFIATVYDQDTQTITLYVDDKMYQKKGVLSGGWDYTNIGSNPSYGGNFDGVIDELRIYNVALSQSEINSIRQGSTVPGPSPTPTPTPTPDSVIDRFNGLTFESRSKATGSSVQIPLTLYGVRDNIGNMDMTLRYDSSVLVATEVVKGSLTSDSLYDYNIIDGTIRISFADKNGFSGDGSVAHVRFDVVGAEGSSTVLDIASLSANRADLSSVNIATKDGVFTVISRDQSKGDAEGDGGELTALDALYALQMAVGKIPEDLAMDMNGDGSVTSIDARQILRSSAKLS